MKLYVFAKILNLLSVIPGLTRNPVRSACSGCRSEIPSLAGIKSGMTNTDFLRDYQNFTTQNFFSDQTGRAPEADKLRRSAAALNLEPMNPEPLNPEPET
jgi:hypothetical protein